MIKKTEILLSHPAHFMALGFGSGLAVIAPGTVGTLWAWASYVLMDYCLGTAQIAGVILASLLMGWWACTVTADHMGVSDPSAIVWDEIVAFWIVLFVLMPAGVGDQLAAFVLFRFFDIAKPGPIGLCDRLFKGRGYKGGFGIMVDDLAAAFFTLLVLALWQATHLS
jgi:phosphatidylglycerophosphatase A